jgi:hypothetical protein
MFLLRDEFENPSGDAFDTGCDHNWLFGVSKIATGTSIRFQKPPQSIKNCGLAHVVLPDKWCKVIEWKRDSLTGSEILNLNVADSMHDI